MNFMYLKIPYSNKTTLIFFYYIKSDIVLPTFLTNMRSTSQCDYSILEQIQYMNRRLVVKIQV